MIVIEDNCIFVNVIVKYYKYDGDTKAKFC